MTDIDTRPSTNAPARAALLDRLHAAPRARSKNQALSPEALEVVAKPAPAPVSLIVVVGFAVFAAYGLPSEGDFWRYTGAIFSIALLSMFAFQTADIYQVQAFRGHEKQYMRLASAWSVVFLIVIGASFFAKAGEMF